MLCFRDGGRGRNRGMSRMILRNIISHHTIFHHTSSRHTSSHRISFRHAGLRRGLRVE